MRSPLLRRFTLLASGSLAAVTLAAVPLASAGAAAPTPATLYPLSTTAGKAQSSVHYVAAQSEAGTKITITADVAKKQGKETVAFSHNNSSGKLSVYANAQGVYLKGSESALSTYMGFPAAPSKKYANRWIVVPASNSAYTRFASGLTMKTAFSFIPVTAPYTGLPAATVNGKSVIGVQGSTSAGSGVSDAIVKFYALATGKPLPVSESLTATASEQDVKASIDYSNWNEAITLPKATSVVPITKVVSTSGSGTSSSTPPTTQAG